MGANFDMIYCEAATEDEAKARFRSAIEQRLHEYGHHAYAGHIGIADGSEFRREKHFVDFDDAVDWLEENAEKWGPALVVRVDPPDGKMPIWVAGAWCAS